MRKAHDWTRTNTVAGGDMRMLLPSVAVFSSQYTNESERVINMKLGI
jgi:hypothetical protein